MARVQAWEVSASGHSRKTRYVCNYLSKIDCIWTLKTNHKVLTVCLLGKLELFVINFTEIFFRKILYFTSTSPCMQHEWKTKLNHNCFYTFNSTLDQLNVNLNSQRFDLTTFWTLLRSVNAIEGKFERFLLTQLHILGLWIFYVNPLLTSN